LNFHCTGNISNTSFPPYFSPLQPLSAEFKDYVLNLDIEADARLLHERLNICEEAIDIFRASSSLLKAGVKAGLTLYDIAVMCCRNDNLGEIPSKLERFSSMASELSSIAIENEKWHHATASRAIEDQLTPKKSRQFTHGRLRKCVSSGEILTLSGDSGESLDDVIAKRESPGMTGSSASDSSLDAGDVLVDTEECEEWAASIIADVSVDQVPPLSRRDVRSDSVGSDDASNESLLSSSPKGFWHVRPGTTRVNEDDDDESITWSPNASPRVTAQEPRFCSLASSPPGRHFTLGANANANTNANSLSKRPSVHFAPILTDEKPFMPALNLAKSKSSDDEKLPKVELELERQESGMTRSKSHPTFSQSFSQISSTSSSSSEVASPRRRPKPFTEEYDNYRKYYEKFIDLVVVREMTAAVHLSKIGSNPSEVTPFLSPI
jgi:hypothetical protein